MKKFYSLLFLLLVTGGSFAGTITAVKSSDWADKNTWNPKRLPKDDDTIVIPAGITVTLDKNYKFDNSLIIVEGNLRLDNGKLRLDVNSKVIIGVAGSIEGQHANDQINIGANLKYNGTEGIIYGYSYADNTTGISPNGFTLFGLPVHFTAFYVKLTGNDVLLTWSTDREENNDHFEIERSNDGRNWKMISTVKGNGTSVTSHQYSYTDKNISGGSWYYRIRQVDMNGQAYYSSVRVVMPGTNNADIRIYATSKQSVAIDFNRPVEGNLMVKVMSLNGQVLASQQYQKPAYQLNMHLNRSVQGLCIVQLSDGNGFSLAQKIIF